MIDFISRYLIMDSLKSSVDTSNSNDIYDIKDSQSQRSPMKVKRNKDYEFIKNRDAIIASFEISTLTEDDSAIIDSNVKDYLDSSPYGDSNVNHVTDVPHTVLEIGGKHNSSVSNWYVSVNDFMKSKFFFKIMQFAIFYIIGTIFYTNEEGWNILDSVYFITVTITTVGYGNFFPTTNASKIFTIFFIIIGTPIIYGIAQEISNNIIAAFQIYSIVEIHRFIIGKNIAISKVEFARYKIYTSLSLVIVMLFAGALFYSSNENWSFLDGMYWSVCTMAAVGYGDLSIQYESTRIFGIFFILFCVCIWVTAANNVFELYYKERGPADETFEEVAKDCDIPIEVSSPILSEEWVLEISKRYRNRITINDLILEVMICAKTIPNRNEVSRIKSVSSYYLYYHFDDS